MSNALFERVGNTIRFNDPQTVSMQLSDGLCFLNGWEAAKGELPDDLATLRVICRELSLQIKAMDWENKLCTP